MNNLLNDLNKQASLKVATLIEALRAAKVGNENTETLLTYTMTVMVLEHANVIPKKLISTTDNHKVALIESVSTVLPLLKNLWLVKEEAIFNAINAFTFTQEVNDAISECSSLNWKEINLDIFGSMVQTVIATSKRANLGMHYTSVENIMKVLNPLFLERLNVAHQEALDGEGNATTKVHALKSLCERLSAIKIGDMACGSGNFLIVAYKELKAIEERIINDILTLGGEISDINKVSVAQFYGIEFEELAHNVAILALGLTELQVEKTTTACDSLFKHIVHGNALRLDWEEVMPNEGEVYIVGNPPYLGTANQNKEQKSDMKYVCGHIKKSGMLDLVAAWFVKGKHYLMNNKGARLALVSTNSVCQGGSVPILWDYMLSDNIIEIGFAYTSFKWVNTTKGQASVMCVIVGLRSICDEDKFIFSEEK